MNAGKLEKPRIPKRFYFITLMLFLPVFYCLMVIRAHWFGFVIAGLSFAGLMWLRHSRFWRGWHATLCFLLAYLAAFGGLSLSRPRWDVSLPGQIGGGTVRLFTHLTDNTVTLESLEIAPWQLTDGYEASCIQLPNCTMEVTMPTGGGNGYAILQLHGGAFVSGLNDLYRRMAVRYSAMAGGAAVFTLDYRLYPDAPYPAQQDDAMDAWCYLTKTLGYSAQSILITGDSAGGNLTLSLALRLRDEGSPMPAALIALSPWADLSNSGPSHITNATIDPSFGLERGKWDGVTPVGVSTTYPDGLNAQDAYLSPSFGDYSGFPPMLIQAGDLEVLLSDSQMVYDNAIQNGVDCTLTVYTGMFHVFQGSLDLLPESREAWKEMADFVGRIWF